MSATTLSTLRTTFAPAAIALLAGIAALGLLFYPECKAAVGVWIASTAYGHCFLVIPMSLYLAWERRDALAGLTARPEPAWAVLALPIAGVWFAAERLGIMEGRQLAALAALELMFLCVLGRTLFRALLAPFVFLVFLVPFGAFVTPVLQSFTAWFIEVGLNLLRIPNFVTDLTIEIPTGTFYVAEACAGLRFLIAAVAFGVFYALLNYRSPGRRIVFMAASVVVPIVANGFRALGIVVLGHILGSAEAAAADHLVYGWVFFSFVMLVLVACGLPFREDLAGPRRATLGHLALAGRSPLLAAAVACALLSVGPATAAVLNRQLSPPAIAALPTWAVPQSCRSTEPATAVTGGQVQRFECGGRTLTVTTLVFPTRSRADSLVRERRRLTGELEAEDAAVSTLQTADPANGRWTLVKTDEPYRISTFASWVDGAPAAGGLSGRVLQARNSVLGAAYAPVLVAAVIASDARMTAADVMQAQALLTGFVAAQPGLTATVASASRVVQ